MKSNKLQYNCETRPRKVHVFIEKSREGHVTPVTDVEVQDVACGVNHTVVYQLHIMYHYIPGKSPYIFSLEQLCDNSLYWVMTFWLSHSDPDPAFQPIAKTHVLYVYVILSFSSAMLPRAWAVAVCRTGMKRQ